MVLQGGPLDGQEQIVQMLPTTPGAQLFFNIPNYQTFEPNTETVIAVGLTAYYALVGQGAGPGIGDSWDTSWIFDFTGEAFVPAPPPLYPPGQGPPTAVGVFMVASTTLVPDSLPITITSPVTVMMTAETAMAAEGLITPFQYGVVAMTGETTMPVTPDWQPQVGLTGESDLDIDGTRTIATYDMLVAVDGPVSYWKLNDPVGSTTVIDSVTGQVGGTVEGTHLTFGIQGPGDTACRGPGIAANDVNDDGRYSYVLTGLTPGAYPAMTLECWVNFEGRPWAQNGSLDFPVAWGNAQTAQVQLGLEGGTPANDRPGNDPLQTQIYAVVKGDEFTSSYIPVVNMLGWNHLAVTYDGTTAIHYLNGVQIGSGAVTPSGPLTASDTAVWIFRAQAWNAGYNAMQIAKVAVYNKVLSAARILTHYQTGLLVAMGATTSMFAQPAVLATGLYAYGYLSNGHVLAHSSDGGATWATLSTPLDIPGTSPHLGIIQMLNAGGLMVGALAGSSNQGYTVLTSVDGVNWIPHTTGMPYASGIAYNEALFVLVGWSAGSGQPAIATSPDGANWTSRSSPFDGGHVRQIAWNGSAWMAVGQSATGPPYSQVATSPDGITWTAHSTPLDSNVFEGAYSQGMSVMWNPNLARWVVGFQPDTNGYGVMGLSPDGTTWTTTEVQHFLPNWVPYYNTSTHQMVWPGQDNSTTNNVIATSTDGVAWTLNPITSAGAATNVSYGASFYWCGVAFSRGGTASALQKATTPTTWTAVPTPFDGQEPIYGLVVV